MLTAEVHGSIIKKLFLHEVQSENEVRRYFDLRTKDIDWTNFEKMIFSIQTAAAIEMAVEEFVLPPAALTTAHFIRLINQWFALVNSKLKKTSITNRNCESKFTFLHKIIEIFQGTVFEKNWRPFIYVMILASLSFCDAAEFLFKNNFQFVIGHGFTQDATENIFSQIRRKEGKMPSAFQCLQGVRMISVAQFVSDVKKSSYCNDADNFLLDFWLPNVLTKNKKQHTVHSLCGEISNSVIRITELEVSSIDFETLAALTNEFDAKNLFHLAGSTTNAIVKKHICDICMEILLQDFAAIICPKQIL